MEHTISTPDSEDKNEISLKEIVFKLQEWIKYLLGKWKLILLFGILGAGLGILYAFQKKNTYIAEVTFVLEDSKSSALGSYAGIASQLGIDLGGASGSGIFAGENIIEFLKSRLMVEKTLLSPINVNNKTISLADYYLEVNEIKEKWAKKPRLKDISFPVNGDRKKFSLLQDSILHVLYTGIIKKNLSVTKPDKKLSFISVKCASFNEMFSKSFTEYLVSEATDFYVQTKTKKSKINVDKLQSKADSLEEMLNRKTFSVAASQDLNLNPSRNLARVSTEVASRDKMVLQTLYAEVVKNLEISRMSMAQETPIIQIVDTPILPLYRERFGKLKGLIYGGFLGGFLIIAFIVIRRLYKQLMVQ